MSFAPQNVHSALRRVIGSLAILLTLVVSVDAQTQDDESKNGTPARGTVSGRVVNEIGQPISHATIYVTAPMSLPQPRITFTDDAGNFQVSGLDPLVYTVAAVSPTYVMTPRDPESLPPYNRIGDSLTISLLKGGVITGTVTSAMGTPMVQTGVRAILIRDADGKPPVGARFPGERLTDDRGIYRIYGLTPGTYVVSAGGRGPYGYSTNAYDTDAPTYAPSSTRDTAVEVVVRGGEETTGVDIHYRGESGHVISGVVTGLTAQTSSPPITINLVQIVNGVPQANTLSFQPTSKGFGFYGVADGDYELIAHSFLGPGESTASEPKRVKVKGADVTGIELVLKALASINGHLSFDKSNVVECRNKKEPLLSETLVLARRTEQRTATDSVTVQNTFSQAAADKAGDFVLRNLAQGQFSLSVRFFAKYWYLRSITRETSGAPPAKTRTGVSARQTDLARNTLSLKSGDRISGVTVKLAEGAASLRGVVKVSDNESVPTNLFLRLVPAEKESTDDVLRFFSTMVNPDGTFVVTNLPPGRYWLIPQVVSDIEPRSEAKLRAPEHAATRTQIRLAAEAARTSVDLKPCQNTVDFQLPFKISAVKNQ